MRRRGLALVTFAVALTACASSGPETSEVRGVEDPAALGCAKVGLLPYSSTSEGGTNFSGGISPHLQAEVRSMGGNAIRYGNARGLHSYVEVWSCPVETVVTPR